MKNPLEICFISPEITPFVRRSELADAAGYLPIALKEMGHDVRVMMPNYKSINERKYVLRDVIRLRDMEIRLGETEHKVSAKSSFLPNSKVQVYFIDNKTFFGRSDIYTDARTGKPFADNDERFAAFCLGCLQTLRVLHWQPQIIHGFGWPAALLPLYLKTIFADEEFFADTRFVLSFHEDDGLSGFPADSLRKLGLPADLPERQPEFVSEGVFDFLRAGILTSDMILPGSESFVQEVLEGNHFSPRLVEALAANRKKIVPMLSGVAAAEWDPETDRYLAVNYSSRTLGRKVENKKIVLEKIGLPFSAEVPLAVYLSAHEEASGFPLLLESLEILLTQRLQIAVLEDGREDTAKSLTRLAGKHKRQLAIVPRSKEMLHLLLAGGDLVLLPAAVAPVASEALRAMRYGTIPVARKTGAFADTVAEYDAKTEQGTGFVFKEPTAEAFSAAVVQAMGVFADAKKWQKLMRNALRENHTWESLANKYAKLYARLIGKK